MNGKTVLVTGATNGIGQETALALARMGAEVVMVARNEARGQATLEMIRAATGNEKLAVLVADLSSQAEVRRVAAEFKSRWTRLDVLVNNAGGLYDGRATTVDGLEYTLALNHLAYFLLTHLLLDLLKASAPARVVNVSSSAEASGRINFEDLQSVRRYGAFAAYSQSKLANVMFTYALAEKLAGSGVTANALHPGVVATGFGKNARNPIVRLVFTLMGRFTLPASQGAATTVFLASSPEVSGISGRYFDKSRAVPSSPRSQDKEAQRRLWEVSEKLTGLA